MAIERKAASISRRAGAPHSSLAPVPKVAASGLAGATSTILVWLLQQGMGIATPPEVVAALTTLLMFGVGYLVGPGAAPGEALVEAQSA